MKSMTVAQAKTDMESLLKASQKERIVLTRGGKPSAVLVGVEAYDEEDLRLATSPEFWTMIEARRTEPSISWDTLKARLKLDTVAKSKTKSTRRLRTSAKKRR